MFIFTKIRESRERAGLSKNQLGEMAKVSHTEIARIEFLGFI